MNRRVLAVLLATGCGGPTEDLTPHPATNALTIPMQPRSTTTVTGLVEVPDDRPTVALRLEDQIVVALAEGYPSDLRAELAAPLWSPCGVLDGTVDLTAVSGADEIVSARAESRAVALRAHAPGTTVLVVGGTVTLVGAGGCELPLDTPIPFELLLTVRVARPAGVAFERPNTCDSNRLLVVASGRLGRSERFRGQVGVRAVLLDDEGAPLTPDNAAPEAEVELHLTSNVDLSRAAPTSLAEWVAPATSGIVEVTSAWGAPTRIEVIDPAAITDAEISFSVVLVKSGLVKVDPGATIGHTIRNESIADVLVPQIEQMRVGSAAVCSSSPGGWFELTSLSRDRCSPQPRAQLVDALYGSWLEEWVLDEGVRLDGNGTCALEIRAPAFDGGNGWSTSWSATFDGTVRGG